MELRTLDPDSLRTLRDLVQWWRARARPGQAGRRAGESPPASPPRETIAVRNANAADAPQHGLVAVGEWHANTAAHDADQPAAADDAALAVLAAPVPAGEAGRAEWLGLFPRRVLCD